MTNEEAQRPKQRRGFGAMSPEKQREIASKGGKAAHEQGVAHQWTADEAKEAGKKGGQASGANRKENLILSVAKPDSDVSL